MKKGLPVPMNTVVHQTGQERRRGRSQVKNAGQYHPNTELLIGADNVEGNEIQSDQIDQRQYDHAGDRPLKYRSSGERYRDGGIRPATFWADADVGTVFWHDHAFGRDHMAARRIRHLRSSSRSDRPIMIRRPGKKSGAVPLPISERSEPVAMA